MAAPTLKETVDLLDWKRQVFDLYREIRTAVDPKSAWTRWVQERDSLFKRHPQSPLPVVNRSSFGGLEYFDYDPEARVLADLTPVETQRYDIPTSTDETMRLARVGEASFELYGADLILELYWLTEYGGGLFVPFRDATPGKETYGAGRYLLDTVKGADLGMEGGRLVLDFNFAYSPSCAYDPKWACPLAPPPNHLDIAVRAGERYAHS